MGQILFVTLLGKINSSFDVSKIRTREVSTVGNLQFALLFFFTMIVLYDGEKKLCSLFKIICGHLLVISCVIFSDKDSKRAN